MVSEGNRTIPRIVVLCGLILIAVSVIYTYIEGIERHNPNSFKTGYILFFSGFAVSIIGTVLFCCCFRDLVREAFILGSFAVGFAFVGMGALLHIQETVQSMLITSDGIYVMYAVGIVFCVLSIILYKIDWYWTELDSECSSDRQSTTSNNDSMVVATGYIV